MQPRRLAALGALGILGAGVVGLVLTGGDDDEPIVAGPAPAADTEQIGVGDDAPGTAATVDTPELAASDAVGTPPDDGAEVDVEAEVAPLRYDPALVPDLPDRGQHPPLLGIDGWQQSDVTSLEELRGKVVAVQFWTFGCSNCKATKPHMAALYEKYGGDDFEIVGIHAPEFDFERDPERIAEAAVDLNVTWPIALDTEKQTFRSWQTGRRFWPRIYLIDRDGNIRYDKIGEGRYDEIDAAVGALIDEPIVDDEAQE